MTPLTKNFCRNGYKTSIGTLETMITAYLMLSPTINLLMSIPAVSIMLSAMLFSSISRRNICSG